ncbi:MAG: hypothetical protein ACXW1P_05935 [Methylophilaceae bacterium]
MAIPKLIRVSHPWQSLLLALLNYAMVAVLAITLAYWSWQLASPAPLAAVPVVETSPQNLAATINAAPWFSNNNGQETSATSSGDMKLVGIFGSVNNASGKHPGFAIFQMSNGKQLHAMLNKEFTPGLKLTDISHDTVTVLQNGIPQTIALDEKSRPVEIPRIKSNNVARPTSNTGKVRQVKIIGVKTEAMKTGEPTVKPTQVPPPELPLPKPSTPDIHTETPAATQNLDDVKYLPVENQNGKYSEKHEPAPAPEAQAETIAQAQQQPEARKGLTGLLDNLKSWVTGKKEAPQ